MTSTIIIVIIVILAIQTSMWIKCIKLLPHMIFCFLMNFLICIDFSIEKGTIRGGHVERLNLLLNAYAWAPRGPHVSTIQTPNFILSLKADDDEPIPTTSSVRYISLYSF